MVDIYFAYSHDPTTNLENIQLLLRREKFNLSKQLIPKNKGNEILANNLLGVDNLSQVPHLSIKSFISNFDSQIIQS